MANQNCSCRRPVLADPRRTEFMVKALQLPVYSVKVERPKLRLRKSTFKEITTMSPVTAWPDENSLPICLISVN